LKITYYSKYSAIGPSSRYRAFQYADLFRSSGFDFRISELFDDHYFDILRTSGAARNLKKIPYTLARFSLRKKQLKADSSDLAVIEQQLFPYLPFVIEQKYLPERFIVEFDDAIYLTHPKKLPRILAAADAIIAGNETLADFARPLNQNVHVVPTALNTSVFRPATKRARNKVIVGWSGLEYNFPYLKLIAPVLRRIVEQYSVEVMILSGSAPIGLEFPFRFEQWNPEREVEQLNQFDIGLMPLKMDDWCKGKCGFKLLQYMSLEIPSIATPVGVNQQIIQHRINGFLAHEIIDWESCLSELVTNAALRENVGKAARATVMEQYSTDVWFPRLAAIYKTYA
jgi:glycosyltransferase involved in cell wall biosynthesis